jgi:hypothetical protein
VLLRRPGTEIELRLVRWRRTRWRRGPSVVGRRRHPVVGRLRRRRRVQIHLRRVAALRRRRCVRPVRRHRAAARVPRNPSPSTQTPRPRTLLAPPSPPSPPPQKPLPLHVRGHRHLFYQILVCRVRVVAAAGAVGRRVRPMRRSPEIGRL